MITQPDLLLTLGGTIYLASIWIQAYRNHSRRSAVDISWYFLAFSFMSIVLFITGKLMLDLRYAVVLDFASGLALCWIALQKVRDRAHEVNIIKDRNYVRSYECVSSRDTSYYTHIEYK